ncbi:hypothetical protein F5H01DRAFT_369306 [Linnemannia elongata]|nr:hypothetical protein F5H01DRAFT_369306 [Linnemannia elongata]
MSPRPAEIKHRKTWTYSWYNPAPLSTDDVSCVIPGLYHDAAFTRLISAGLGLMAPESLSLGHG